MAHLRCQPTAHLIRSPYQRSLSRTPLRPPQGGTVVRRKPPSDLRTHLILSLASTKKRSGKLRNANAGRNGTSMCRRSWSGAGGTAEEGFMTKGRAIKIHCLGCAGDSALEVTLCEITNCPLWEHRLGCSPESRAYHQRFTRALASHPDRAEELSRVGIDMAFLSTAHAKSALPGANDHRVGVEGGADSPDVGNGSKRRAQSSFSRSRAMVPPSR